MGATVRWAGAEGVASRSSTSGQTPPYRGRITPAPSVAPASVALTMTIAPMTGGRPRRVSCQAAILQLDAPSSLLPLIGRVVLVVACGEGELQ